MTLQEICSKQCKLQQDDIQQLSEIEKQLPLIAQVCGADVFIDCIIPHTDTAVVVAQAQPSSEISVYKRNVVGEYAELKMEPAVIHCFELQAPVSDMKAVTQENRNVMQSAFPVFNLQNKMIGAVVSERDISRELEHEKKFEHLAKNYERSEAEAGLHDSEDLHMLALREMHHRIKNDFQLMASIFSMQARRCRGTQTEKYLLDALSQSLTIAAIHDMLLPNNTQNGVVSCRSLG